MHLDLGDTRVDVVSDGTFRLDGGAMFGVVPKPLWNRVSPADERNRIRLALNCLLIRNGADTILVDTGMGARWSDKERSIYALENAPGLIEALAGFGVAPGDVTMVINTHLHFDHAGGNTIDVDGVPTPTYPNARYVVQEGEFRWAMSPTPRDRASYLRPCFEPVHEAGLFDLVDGNVPVSEGVFVRRLPGHTPNLQGVLVEGGGRTVFFPSDLCPTRNHLPFPWVMGYDLMPLVTLESKTHALTEAAEKDWIVVFQHEPDTPVGRVRLEDGKPVFEPVET